MYLPLGNSNFKAQFGSGTLHEPNLVQNYETQARSFRRYRQAIDRYTLNRSNSGRNASNGWWALFEQPKKKYWTDARRLMKLRLLWSVWTTVLCKSNASEFRRISWLFLAFRRNFPSNEISATFPQTFKAPIVLYLGNFRTIIHGGR